MKTVLALSTLVFLGLSACQSDESDDCRVQEKKFACIGGDASICQKFIDESKFFPLPGLNLDETLEPTISGDECCVFQVSDSVYFRNKEGIFLVHLAANTLPDLVGSKLPIKIEECCQSESGEVLDLVFSAGKESPFFYTTIDLDRQSFIYIHYAHRIGE